MTIKHIEQTTLKSLLDYDELTGVFTWKIATRNGIQPGTVAGCLDGGSGYWMIRINGRNYSAHRLAFIWMLGSAPDMIDHKNRISSDNSWLNLRPTNTVLNAQNTTVKSTNVLGFKNITRNPFGNYHARITPIFGKRISKTFKTLDEAKAFVEKHRRIEHGDFSCD